MSIYANIKTAKDFGLDREWAINRRRQYLTEQLMEAQEDEEELLELVEHCGLETALNRAFSIRLLERHYKQKFTVRDELETIKKMTKDPKEQITDDMIEVARRYPVERLVKFTRKKARAWCHEDKNPSLVHMDRKNFAWCPVCDRKFDAIGCLIDRDGMRFVDAVKYLTGGG